MKVRIIVPWQTYSKGAIIDPPRMQADWLIEQGFARPVGAEPETAAIAPAPVNRFRRKGKP